MRDRLGFWLGLGLTRAVREILDHQRSILADLGRIEHKLGFIMAQNAEVLAFAARVDKATDNIAADIARIIANQSTVLSDEDRATLEASVARLEALDAQNPDGTVT